jgi:hypothetical protein
VPFLRHAVQQMNRQTCSAKAVESANSARNNCVLLSLVVFHAGCGQCGGSGGSAVSGQFCSTAATCTVHILYIANLAAWSAQTCQANRVGWLQQLQHVLLACLACGAAAVCLHQTSVHSTADCAAAINPTI